MNRNIAKQFTATLSLLDVASNKTNKYKCFHGEDIQLTVNVVGEEKRPLDLSNTNVKIYFTLDKNVNEPVYRQDTGIVVDHLGVITVMLEKSYIRIGNNTLKIVLYDEDQTVFLQPLIITCIDPLIGEVADLETPGNIDVRDELYDIRRIIGDLQDVDDDLGREITEARNECGTVRERLDNFDSQLDDIERVVDTTIEKQGLSKIKELIYNSYMRNVNNVNYFIVGDSTREANGAYIFKNMRSVLRGFNVKTTLQAKSGLKASHWSEANISQTGFPIVSDLIALIPNDGTNCIIDICLGINDTSSSSASQIAQYIQTGIAKIKQAKPNVLINLTSPNRYFHQGACNTLKEAYTILTTNNPNFGFIDVLDNVWKEWTDNVRNNYFVDNTHPNKLGQEKMFNYIIDKILPNINKYQEGIPNFKGELDDTFVSDQDLSGVGFSIELKFLGEKPSDELYLKKHDGEWYIFNPLSSASLTEKLPMENGVFELKKARWCMQADFECFIEIRDYTAFDKISVDASYRHPIINGVVKEFTKFKTYRDIMADNKEFRKRIEKLENEKASDSYFNILKGSIDKTDANYEVLKNANFRVELKQTKGTPYTSLSLMKNPSGNYYLYADGHMSESVSDYIQPIVGTQRISIASWNITSDFDCYVTIDDPESLINFSDTSTPIKLKNCFVDKFTKDMTMEENIRYIIDNI